MKPIVPMSTAAATPLATLPRFIIGDDCLDAAQARLFVVHLQQPRFVLHVEFSTEQGTNLFHPIFLDDASKLAPAEKDGVVRDAISFYNAAWRRAVLPPTEVAPA